MVTDGHSISGGTTNAPFWRRLAARLIDLALAIPLTFLVVIPVSLITFLPAALVFDRGSGAYNIALNLTVALCFSIAFVLLEWFLLVRRDGQTLGKGLMGLRVRAARRNAPLTVVSSLVRLLILLVPFALMSIAGESGDEPVVTNGWDTLAYIGFLALLASLLMAAIPVKQRRTLHDLAGGSRVVLAPKRAIRLKQDVRMMIPGRVDLTKR